MKKTHFRYVQLMPVILLLFFTISSCGDDKEDENNTQSGIETPIGGSDGIIGSWFVTVDHIDTDYKGAHSAREFMAFLFDKCYVSFSKNGTFTNHTSGESNSWTTSMGDKGIFAIGQQSYTIQRHQDSKVMLTTCDSRYTIYYLLTPSAVEQLDDKKEKMVNDNGYITSNLSATPPSLVDLGLSVPWADMNYKAESNNIGGGKMSFSSVDAAKKLWSSLQGTRNDIARITYGGYWAIPTKEEFEELLSKCKWETAKHPSDKKTDCYKVTGNNGNTIYLPLGKYISLSKYYDKGNVGFYTLELTSNSRSIGKCEWVQINYDKYVDPKENSFYVRPIEKISTSIINQAEKVDLGLSVHWAGTNLGAATCSDMGKFVYWANPTATRSVDFNDSYQATETDIARIYMGNRWCTPNKSQVLELMQQCRWDFITVDGVNGYKVTGPNCNAIFIPGAGGYSSYNSRTGNGYLFYWIAGAIDQYDWDNKKNGTFFKEGTFAEGGEDLWLPIRAVLLTK